MRALLIEMLTRMIRDVATGEWKASMGHTSGQYHDLWSGKAAAYYQIHKITANAHQVGR